MFNTMGALVSGFVFNLSRLAAFAAVTSVCGVLMPAVPRRRALSAHAAPALA
jgi:hypothetical protein